MKMLWILITAAGLLASTAHVNAQSGAQQGTWINDHGSALVIHSIGPDGALMGTYSNGIPDYKCRGVAFPIVGWVDGEKISFTTRWKNASVDCASITSWTGYFRQGALLAEWVLVYVDDTANQPKVRLGSDQYKRK